MSAKKSYNRFFIIFQEEDKGYGVGPDRPPTGYVKVETKNDKSKVTVYVQNLKPFENAECLYKCYLISHQGERDNIAYLGIMNIDELGRGESAWESGADNVFDSKMSIDKFNAAAIIVEKEGADATIAPLAGYMSKEKFEWRSKIPVKRSKVEVIEESVKIEEQERIDNIELSGEAKKFEEYEKQIEEISNRQEEEVEEVLPEVAARESVECKEQTEVTESIEETRDAAEDNESEEEIRDTAEDIEEYGEDIEEADIFEDVDMEVEEDLKDEEIRSKHKQKEEYYKCGMYEYSKNKYSKCMFEDHCKSCMGSNKYDIRKIMKKAIEDIMEEYEEIDLHKRLHDCRMWKIDMKKYSKDVKKVFVYPYYDLILYPMMNNPYCNYLSYIRRHGHYLFGIKYSHSSDREIKKILFGIPGSHTIIDQPFQGITGFMTWLPSKSDTSDGYWIMSYDPMTGRVTLPDE